MHLAEKFHILSHTFISLIGAVLLLAIWYNIRWRFQQILSEEDSTKRVDKGLAYLSAAIFVWVLSGLWAFFVLETQDDNFLLSHSIRSLLSTLNNFFLLMALFFFSNSPAFIYKNDKNIRLITVGIVLLSVISVVLFTIFGYDSFAGLKISFIPDLLLSGFLSYLLAVTLYKTFEANNLRVVAVVSVIIIGILFYSQLPEVFSAMDNDFTNGLMKIIAKTSLIAIFLVVATNWVIQLAGRPKQNEMHLHIQDWSLIVLSVPSKNIHNATIDFKGKTTQFQNLVKFAIRRKLSAGENQYIDVGYGKEIQSQTYLSRIVENINQILLPTDIEKLSRNDLFTFVGQGKYRLRMIPQNIDIDDAFLTEFIKKDENESYEAFVRFSDPVAN